jgi:hypothetical protein
MVENGAEDENEAGLNTGQSTCLASQIGSVLVVLALKVE